MLVYGDRESIETVDEKRRSVERSLDRISALPPGHERHAALIAAFIGASELVQGLIDADFEARGYDALSPTHVDGMGCLMPLACSIVQSWRSGFSQTSVPEVIREKLHRFDSNLTVRIKQAEGYAFYALYPESYVEAALRSGLGPETRIIGIRSIGAGLSSLVAAALGSSAPFTVRPVGHPFQREVKVDPEVTAMLTQDPNATFAVVDEGPGLSGSSFGAVADWLEAAGVARKRIHFFPSHAGQLGPQASPSHRARWDKAARHFLGMDSLLLEGGSSLLTQWVESLTGPLQGRLEDISGGAWRRLRYDRPEFWPAANIQQERRKFLARTQEATWHVKFAGLGENGWRKKAQARHLHEAGFTSEIAGLRHGFLVERWHERAPSLDQHPIERGRLVDHLGIYLGFRARHFPAPLYAGASLLQLHEMARYNTMLALGEEAAGTIDRILTNGHRLSSMVRPVFTDSRLHPSEWLVIGERLIKTDALDHSTAHDLVGCQDIAWDIAGAAVEFNLSNSEIRHLCRVVEKESGRPVAPELLVFMAPCYLAFQIGSHTMAADALRGSEEEPRLRSAAEKYGVLLKGYLERPDRLCFNKEQDKVPAG